MTSPASGAVGADMRALLPPVRDQSQRGTCLAFAVTSAHEVSRAAGAAVREHLSEEALYWACKRVDGNWHSGTRFSSAAVAIQATGQPLDALWPYDPTRLDGVRYDPPSKPGADWHTSGLESGTASLEAIRKEIDGGRPVLLGLTVFDNLFIPTGAGRIEPPTAGSPPRGGHAVLAVGYDATALLIRNSWGPSWAMGGYGWLSDEYVNQHVRAAWVIEAPAGGATPPANERNSGDVYGTA